MIDEGETDRLSEGNATNELSKKIEPINRDTVHKICSGQVGFAHISTVVFN